MGTATLCTDFPHQCQEAKRYLCTEKGSHPCLMQRDLTRVQHRPFAKLATSYGNRATVPVQGRSACNGGLLLSCLLPQCQATPVGALEGVEDEGALLHTACGLACGMRGEPVVREHRIRRPMLLAVLEQRHPYPRHLHATVPACQLPFIHVFLHCTFMGGRSPCQ